MKRTYEIRRVWHGESVNEPMPPVQGTTFDIYSSADVGPAPMHRSARFVAMTHGRMVGSMTLQGADQHSPCAWYRRPEVAILRQLVIDPQYRDRGCTDALLDVALHWARANGYSELAVEVPTEPAELIPYFQSRGFRIVDSVHAPDSEQVDAVLSQSIGSAKRRTDAVYSPQRGKWFVTMASA